MVALFVILTILVCVGIDGIVQLRKARKESASLNLADQLLPAAAFANLSAPANLFLDSGHTWVEVKPSGVATIGLDGFAQKLIGRIDDVVLPEVGKEINRGDVLFALKQNNHRAAFASPVDGTVVMVDRELPWHPEMIQSDPYKEGWICSVKPRNLAKNLKQLLTADESIGWLKNEAQRFQEFFAAQTLDSMQLGQVLQDGGQLMGGVLEYADDGTWKQFNEMFLRPQHKEA
ncbi:MAG: glycine cleavage system protein H [Pyrinomonadaceae bacterium]